MTTKRRTTAPKPAKITKIAVLGLGKAGGSLVASAQRARVRVVAKGRRSLRSFKDADALFIAVPDDALDDVVGALAKRQDLPRVVAHLSGARGTVALHALLGDDALTQGETTGTLPFEIGTFHPLAALDGKSPIPPRTFIAVAGTTRAVSALTALAAKLGLSPGHVHDDHRARYHAGAVVAGNLATALLAKGTQLLVESGVPAALARQSLARLLLSTAQNAIDRDLERALTGPVSRGDVATLERHLELLDRDRPDIAEIYRLLSRVLVEDVVPRHPRAAAMLSALAAKR